MNNTLVGSIINNKNNLQGTIDKITDYERLINKPKIESVELIGNKTLQDFGIREISNQEILDIANKILFTEGI